MGFGRRRGSVSEEEEAAVAVAMDGGRSSSGVLGGGGFGLVVPRLIRDREACETVREETMGGIAREGGLETWASAFLTRKAYYEIFTRRGRIRVWKGTRPLKHCNSTL